MPFSFYSLVLQAANPLARLERLLGFGQLLCRCVLAALRNGNLLLQLVHCPNNALLQWTKHLLGLLQSGFLDPGLEFHILRK